MLKFVSKPATAQSIAQRKRIQGVGINDATYLTKYTHEGKEVRCPIYQKWVSMLRRCYSAAWLKRCPSYAGCTVANEWLTFSNFANWYTNNYVAEFHLDKDFKVAGNTEYGPDTCLFIPQELNKLLTGSLKSKELPKGVSLNKKLNKYGASISISKQTTHLGVFNTVEEAQQAYAKAKNKHIKSKMLEYPEFAQYLQNHLLKEG